MRRGENLLIACPSCGKEYLQEDLVSGNTRGARYWTDGKRDAPMLPTMPALTRCEKCKTIFHVDDAEIIADGRPLTLYSTGPKVRFLTLAELLECIEIQPESIKERGRQISVRTELLHKKNDYYRYSASSFEPDLNDSRIVRNIEILAELLTESVDAENTNGLMLRAELLREMGRFEESAAALQSIPQEARSIPLFETMKRLIQNRDNRIYEYNPDTGMPLSPEEFTSTALTQACSTSDLDLVTFFAERTGQEKLNEAVSSLYIYEDQALPVLRILLKEGADINTQDRAGRTLLHEAIEEEELPTAKKLLEMGIDPDRVDVLGNTPLILAAQAVTILEYTDVITELLRRGAHVNRRNNRGETAYSKAKHMKYTQVMEILSEAGADTTLGPEEDEEENSNGLKRM